MLSLRSSLLLRSLPAIRHYATKPPSPSTAAADLPVAPPHNSLPFAAPSAFEDKDTTKGSGLGQVKMPDMERVERGATRAEEEVGRVVSLCSLSRRGLRRGSAGWRLSCVAYLYQARIETRTNR